MNRGITHLQKPSDSPFRNGVSPVSDSENNPGCVRESTCGSGAGGLDEAKRLKYVLNFRMRFSRFQTAFSECVSAVFSECVSAVFWRTLAHIIFPYKSYEYKVVSPYFPKFPKRNSVVKGGLDNAVSTSIGRV